MVILALAILIAPPIDLAVRFFPTDLETFESANRILAFTRIPHHSDPLQWTNWWDFGKLLFAVAAIAATTDALLKSTLVSCLSLAIGGTLLVIFTRSADIALIAPWRVSILIVPVAIAILTGTLVERLLVKFTQQALLTFSFAICTIFIASYSFINTINTFETRSGLRFIQLARNNHRSSDVYLTSPYNESFRLEAMTAQFVSWKTHPYLDTEVIEWKRRIDLANAVFGREGNTIDCAALHALVAARLS